MKNALTQHARGLLALLLACLAFAPLNAGATIRTVTSLADSGAGTLRDTIAASAANDTIVFSVSGTITLTSGGLVIGRNLTITGPGAASLILSGNSAGRVLNISSGINVTLSGLTIANGFVPGFDYGGGILDYGNLTLVNCQTRNNDAKFGSGICVKLGAGLTATNCCFNDNGLLFGSQGGALFLEYTSQTALYNCTFSHNACLYNEGSSGVNGGAISAGSTCSLLLVNCTICSNVVNDVSHVAGYGGGLLYGGGSASIQIQNTIISGNSASEGGPDVSCLIIASLSAGHNLIGKKDGSFGWMGSDLTGTVAAPLNPLLGPLQDNGGPTFTMALLATSAAIDAGDDAVLGTPLNLTTDQRGHPRRSGAHVDIGAYELDFASSAPTVTNTADSGPGSLRQAIVVANSGDTITFATNVTGTITLTTGELAINKNLNVTGPGAKTLTVSGNHASRIFNIYNGAVTISGLTIANGYWNSGGAVYVNDTAGNVSFSACNITSNSVIGAGAFGGGIFVNSGNVTFDSCAISYNQAGWGGGGIYNNSGGVLTLLNCTVSSNLNFATFSPPHGGGIENDGIATLINTTVTGNSSVQGGGQCGGVFTTYGYCSLRGSLVAGNTDAGTAPDLAGTFDSRGYNLIGKTNGCTLTNNLSQNHLGSIAAPLNPLLGPFADNGGPTFTHALLTGSPAIDAGDDAVLNAPLNITSDQRGFPRKSGAHVDIGAYEVGVVSATAATLGAVSFGNNHLQFLLTGTAGWNYVVQASTNLAGGNWVPVVTNAAPFTFVQSNANTFPRRFYRAVSSP